MCSVLRVVLNGLECAGLLTGGVNNSLVLPSGLPALLHF